MDEAEWRAATDPGPMLEFLRGKADERKLQLFICACCRRIWHLLADERSRNAVVVAERYAEGQATREELEAAERGAADAFGAARPEGAPWDPDAPFCLASYAANAAHHTGSGGNAPWTTSFAANAAAYAAAAHGDPAWAAARLAELAAQAHLLRDIIGDPSRPFEADLDWLDRKGGDCVRLAQEIAASGRFDDLPRLAVALRAAGCTDRKMVEHCRSGGPHVRGCWVIDALLGAGPGVRAGLVTEDDWHGCENPIPLLEHLRGKGSDRQWQLFGVACCRRAWRLLTHERSRAAVDVVERYTDGHATSEEFAAARSAAEAAREEAHLAEYHAEAEAGFSLTPEYCVAQSRLFGAEAVVALFSRDTLEQDLGGRGQGHYWCSDRVLAALTRQAHGAAQVSGAPGERARAAEAASRAVGAREAAGQAAVIRDIFGIHFGPVGREQRWLHSNWHPRRPWLHWSLMPLARTVRVDPAALAWHDAAVPKLARAIYGERAFDRLPLLADALEDAGCADVDLLGHLRGAGPHVRGCWAVDLVLGKG